MIRLRGTALHSGRPTEIALDRADLVTWNGAPREELAVVRLDQGVAVRAGSEVVDLAEHAWAAIGGLSVVGARVLVEGGEVPLLGGGSREIGAALVEVGAPRGPRRRRVVRRAEIAIGPSRYLFEPASAPSIEVEIVFDHPAIGQQRAAWEGDADDFLARIAPARTFGFLRDHEALLSRGRARGATLDGLLVLDDVGVAKGCVAGPPDEPARHKLLDLVGDLELTGGVPEGRVVATRPGHAATHAAVAEAVRRGALADA